MTLVVVVVMVEMVKKSHQKVEAEMETEKMEEGKMAVETMVEVILAVERMVVAETNFQLLLVVVVIVMNPVEIVLENLLRKLKTLIKDMFITNE